MILCYNLVIEFFVGNPTQRTELTDSHLFTFFRSFSLVFSYFLTFSFFEYTVIIFIIVYTIKISRPWSIIQIPDKILVSSQKFLSDIPPRIFDRRKSQIITKLDFFTLPQKVQKLVLFNNSKAFQELHIVLF